VDHFGLMATPWIGALVVFGAWLLTTWSGALDRKAGFDALMKPVAVCAH
jgi:predicted MFS family arabinose efflux permease